jgi:hypothetical protein
MTWSGLRELAPNLLEEWAKFERWCMLCYPSLLDQGLHAASNKGWLD